MPKFRSCLHGNLARWVRLSGFFIVRSVVLVILKSWQALCITVTAAAAAIFFLVLPLVVAVLVRVVLLVLVLRSLWRSDRD